MRAIEGFRTNSSFCESRDPLALRDGLSIRDGVEGDCWFSKTISSFRDSRENLMGFGRKKMLAQEVRGGGVLIGTKMSTGQGMTGER